MKIDRIPNPGIGPNPDAGARGFVVRPARLAWRHRTAGAIGVDLRLPAVAICFALAACSLGPDYKRPDVAVPAQYRDAQQPAGEKSLADLAWWDLYRDPVLERLIAVALERNYDVRVALARVDEFRATAGVAGLGSIPQVSVGTDASHSRISAVGPSPVPAGTQLVRSTFDAGVNVSYEVDLWKRIASLQDAARADLLASEYARDTTRVTVIASVATSYFALRSLDRQLVITRRTLVTREKFLELTRAQMRRGVVSGLDVGRAEASVATARAVIPDLQRQIIQTENALQILLGENPAPILRDTPTDSAFFPLPPEVPSGLPAALLERRPDLRLAESTLLGANARLRSVKASLFPTISLTGNYGWQSTQLSNLFTGPAKVWSFGLSLLQPIIDVNRNKFQVDVYTAREQQAIAQYQQAVAQAFREVSDALAARQGYDEQIRAQEQQVAALRAVTQRVMKRYAAGYSSYFEVIDADGNLFAAELLLAQAYQNALVSLVQLYKALGGGWLAQMPETSPPDTGG